MSEYPILPGKRTDWILSQRGPRNAVDAAKPYAFLVENEPSASGEIVSVAVIFLTNAECPWKCVMCDLWRNTLVDPVQTGDIPSQIDYALERLPQARQIKLYNSGSFFDPNAIPPSDYCAIADRLRPFERVIVECHPSLVNDTVLGFRELLSGELEVAMGLETVHPAALAALNKRMTLADYERAARFLGHNGIALRAFVLVQPPFIGAGKAEEWAARSAEFAFEYGATAVSLIPTRFGNGALEALSTDRHFTPPTLHTFEATFSRGLALERGRVFADLWDLQNFSVCDRCFAARRRRLERMNLEQRILAPITCDCGT